MTVNRVIRERIKSPRPTKRQPSQGVTVPLTLTPLKNATGNMGREEP